MDVDTVLVLPGRTAKSTILHIGDGFYYHVKEVRPRRIRLKCRHAGRGCKATARITLCNNRLELRALQPHTVCQRDEQLPEDIEARAELVREAGQCRNGHSVRKTSRDFRLKLDPELAKRFTISRMHSPLYRARCANYPRIPKTLMNLGLLLGMPNLRPICKTVQGEDYIFQGVVGTIMSKTVSVVFASGRMLHFLSSCTNLHLDGTFKKRPRKPKCRQIFNLVTRFGRTVVGVIRVLMMSRSEQAYVTLFSFIKQLVPDLNPERIHWDFERATINALRFVFPNTDIVGCLWHFGVCIGRNADKEGLAPLANKNDVVHSFIRCLSGAPLLPATLIETRIDEIWELVEAAGWAEDLEPLFRYFRREWLPRVNELSVFSQEERTNNCSESDNRSIATAIPQNRPNIFTLIGGFIQLEHISWSDKMAVECGNVVHGPPRWKTLANDKKVKRLSELLVKDQIRPGRFLELISWVNQGALNHGMKLDVDSASDSDDE
ncbi:Endonuclease MutS2 [Frankliniella fusca]|uniref:Endonuclease MutS2 n=1 Tax=Frankliniella fusca TaxID=407009 RepID=A0AAE1L7S9_9NEOP|nr:Endonuclease MutS2 [Frankliniella fusca]